MSNHDVTSAENAATVASQMEAAQTALGVSNQDLCTALGFEREIALTLIQAGSMKMPLTKIPALAAALALDPRELLKIALQETSPELLVVINAVFNPMNLSATEVNLINHLRELCGDRNGAPIVFDGKTVIAMVAA